MPLKEGAKPRMEGGNIVVEVVKEDYSKAMEELRFSVIGRLFLRRGEITPSTFELKERLQLI